MLCRRLGRLLLLLRPVPGVGKEDIAHVHPRSAAAPTLLLLLVVISLARDAERAACLGAVVIGTDTGTGTAAALAWVGNGGC